MLWAMSPALTAMSLHHSEASHIQRSAWIARSKEYGPTGRMNETLRQAESINGAC
jgi:hypothetical protein